MCSSPPWKLESRCLSHPCIVCHRGCWFERCCCLRLVLWQDMLLCLVPMSIQWHSHQLHMTVVLGQIHVSTACFVLRLMLFRCACVQHSFIIHIRLYMKIKYICLQEKYRAAITEYAANLGAKAARGTQQDDDIVLDMPNQVGHSRLFLAFHDCNPPCSHTAV